ncbi:MAG: cupin domain-containing protein [Erysipelotrichales bacterium]
MELIELKDALNFREDTSARQPLFSTSNLDTALLLYKPNQTTPDHTHKDLDEVFYVISGEGTITINDVPHFIKEGDTVFSPRDKKHGFNNTSDKDWVVMQIKLSV